MPGALGGAIEVIGEGEKGAGLAETPLRVVVKKKMAYDQIWRGVRVRTNTHLYGRVEMMAAPLARVSALGLSFHLGETRIELGFPFRVRHRLRLTGIGGKPDSGKHFSSSLFNHLAFSWLSWEESETCPFVQFIEPPLPFAELQQPAPDTCESQLTSTSRALQHRPSPSACSRSGSSGCSRF